MFDRIRRYTERVVERLKPQAVILFGSFARRDINEGSDVDILVVADFKEPFLDRIKFLLDLNDGIGLPLEPIGYTPEEFQMMQEKENRFIQEVFKTGKVLYGTIPSEDYQVKRANHDWPKVATIVLKWNGGLDTGECKLRALTFWKTVVMDQANLLERLIALLKEHNIRFCVIGGHAVNAYVEPVVTLDLDIVVAIDQIDKVEKLLAAHFQVKRFAHSINVSLPGSDLRVQIQTDPRYVDFVERASEREVLGMILPVASLEDTLRGKIWAAQDLSQRPSKRQKDLADIARLLEAYPELRDQVPKEILERLL